MPYKYYNKFNLSNELAQSISSIISQKENVDYICTAIVVTIPEHRGLVFSSPLDGYNAYGGGLNALSGAQINAINEKYGKYVEGTIPAENYAFLIVMDNDSLQTFSKFSFKSYDEIKRTLDVLSIFNAEYNGIFDSRTLSQKFPYLQDFFDSLDEWRAKTGRVTIDDDILESSAKKVLNISKQGTKRK